jgi:hypothetical protein
MDGPDRTLVLVAANGSKELSYQNSAMRLMTVITIVAKIFNNRLGF